MDTPAFDRSPFSLALSVIVVSADSGPALRECVRSVLASPLPLEVILVDNASEDGVPAATARAYANDVRFKLIANHANLGFGPAANLGARKARGRALLVLNPDCVLRDGQLEQLLEVLSSYPRIGLLGAVVCDADGQPDPASWRRDPLLRRSLNSLFGRDGEKVNVSRDIPPGPIEVEAVSGAVMMLPRAVFQHLHGFDEDYFLHCEDLDLCRRVRDAGYKVVLDGSVHVEHGRGSSSRHRPVFVSRWKHRGMWRWFRTHDPAARQPVLAALVWLGIWAHFAVKVPGQWLRAKRVKPQPPTRDD